MENNQIHMFNGSSGATFSPNKRFRYKLWRGVEGIKAPMLGFIMLNPSTADASINDPTITRCLARAKSMGYGGIIVTNLYAFRTMSPKVLAESNFPVGDLNDDAITEMANECKTIIAAWGAHAKEPRVNHVLQLLKTIEMDYKLYHLGLTKAGQPRHPLYISYDVEPIKYEATNA